MGHSERGSASKPVPIHEGLQAEAQRVTRPSICNVNSTRDPVSLAHVQGRHLQGGAVQIERVREVT